jgi:hypothetical protein
MADPPNPRARNLLVDSARITSSLSRNVGTRKDKRFNLHCDSLSFPEGDRDRTPAQIIRRILDEVTAFADGRSQRDDVTLVVVGVNDGA